MRLTKTTPLHFTIRSSQAEATFYAQSATDAAVMFMDSQNGSIPENTSLFYCRYGIEIYLGNIDRSIMDIHLEDWVDNSKLTWAETMELSVDHGCSFMLLSNPRLVMNGASLTSWFSFIWLFSIGLMPATQIVHLLHSLVNTVLLNPLGLSIYKINEIYVIIRNLNDDMHYVISTFCFSLKSITRGLLLSWLLVKLYFSKAICLTCNMDKDIYVSEMEHIIGQLFAVTVADNFLERKGN